MFGRFREQVAPPSQDRCQGHHKLLPDRIDRRIRHLCEKLLEVGIKESWLQRKDSQRSVVSHRAKGFLTVFHHGLQDHVEFFTRVPKRNLPLCQSQNIELFLRFGDRPADNLLQTEQVCTEPLKVGLLHRKLLFYFGISQEFTRASIDGDHLTWRKTALLDYFRIIDVVAAGLRAKAHESVFRNLVSCRSKSVSIETGGYYDSIAEYQSRRTIPRFI